MPPDRPSGRSTDPTMAGYAGHLYPWKGVDVFVRALALAPDMHGLIVGGHPGEADRARVQTLVDSLGLGDARRRSPAWCRRASRAAPRRRDRARAAEHRVGDLRALHVAAEAVRVPDARPADRRVRSAGHSRSARPTAHGAARAAGRSAGARGGARGGSPPTRRSAIALGEAARGARARVHLGRARRAARSARSRRPRSDDLARRSSTSSSVRIAAAARADRRSRWSCARLRPRLRRAARLPRSAAARRVRRADEISRRSAARRRAARIDRAAAARLEDPQRHAAAVPGSSVAGDRVDRSRLRQRPHARLERRRGARADRHRHQPVLRARSRSTAAISLLGDLRRLPLRDGAFNKAWSLDVLEHLSPQALARRARRSQPRAGRRRRAVRLHARAQERLDRRRRAARQPLRARSASGSACSICARSGCASPITSIRSPITTTSRASSRRVRLPDRAHHVLHARSSARSWRTCWCAWPSGGSTQARGRADAGRDQPSDAVRDGARDRRRPRVARARRDVSRARRRSRRS